MNQLTPEEIEILKEIATRGNLEFYIISTDQTGEWVRIGGKDYAAKEFNGVLETRADQIKFLDTVRSLIRRGYLEHVRGVLYRITGKGLRAIGM